MQILVILFLSVVVIAMIVGTIVATLPTATIRKLEKKFSKKNPTKDE